MVVQVARNFYLGRFAFPLGASCLRCVCSSSQTLLAFHLPKPRFDYTLKMSGMDLCGEVAGGEDDRERVSIRPRVPSSSITSFGQSLGLAELKALGKELEAKSEGEKLAFPFSTKLSDLANAALFFAHNGRLDDARAKLEEGRELVSKELGEVDDSYRKEGIRHDRVSMAVEQLVKANAFLHFLGKGVLLRKADLGREVDHMEYLGAVMGLTWELARYAITQASVLDHDSVSACAALCHELFGELIQFDFRNGPLRKKFDSVKYELKKIDGIQYELSLIDFGGDEDGTGVGRDGGGGNDFGRKRGREGDGAVDSGVLVDKQELGTIRGAMVAIDEEREVVIKRTRDIQKWSKMAIYSLHRGDFKRARKQLCDCQEVATQLSPIIQATPQLRQGAYSSAMEELAEAQLYELWLKERRLGSRAEIGLVDTEEYLGGMFDLTGEINRFAVARATERDTQDVKECLETVLVIHEFVTLHNMPSKVARKKKELNFSLRKLQNMTYELALMKAGKGKVAGISGLGDDVPGAGKEDEDEA